MRIFFLVLTLLSSLSMKAETMLGREFYQTPVQNTGDLYLLWGHIQKDRDDVLDHLVVRSYERPYRMTCEYFRNLNYDYNIRFPSPDYGGSTFILAEPCQSNRRVLWIKGYVSRTGQISVLEHALE